MKALRNFVDKIKPQFQKGGKFEKLESTFDAIETFLFVPNHVTRKGTHIRDSIDLKRTMTVVIVALLPALLWGMYNVGFQYFKSIGALDSVGFWQLFGFGFIRVMPIVIVSYVTGLAIEFAFAQMKGHEVNEGFLVTGMLIPLIMPVNIPLWMVAVATAFSVIIGKEIFGGTGMNIFNPALICRAFLFFAYPSEISGDLVWIADLKESITAGIAIDARSGATALALAKQNAVANIAPVSDLFFGFVPGSIGETSKFAILIGAVILIFTGIGNWKIMLSGVAGALVMGTVFNLMAGSFPDNQYLTLPPWQHLLMGGFAFGMVFMATDPVSASQTEIGKWIYGFMIGLIVVLIRVANPAYPEATMLVILLMNVFAPLIDYYVVESNIKRRLKRAKVKA